jgi:hypothetical protein
LRLVNVLFCNTPSKAKFKLTKLSCNSELFRKNSFRMPTEKTKADGSKFSLISFDIAKAIPPESWRRIVKTACSEFEKLIAPITQLTWGVGRLIKAKFDRLTDPEKIVVAQTFAIANEKASASKRERNPEPNAVMLTKIINNADAQANANLRDLWSNLLARELTSGSVHPEVADILAQLTVRDVIRLFDLAMDDGEPIPTSWKWKGILPMQVIELKYKDMILERLGLLKFGDDKVEITKAGTAFLHYIKPVIPEQK